MSLTSSNTNTALPDQVDVRGPRFAAWVTTVVLVVVLLMSAFSPPAAAVLLSAQAAVFAITAWRGPRRSRSRTSASPAPRALPGSTI